MGIAHEITMLSWIYLVILLYRGGSKIKKSPSGGRGIEGSVAAVFAAFMLAAAVTLAVVAAAIVAFTMAVVMVAAADVGALGQDTGNELHDSHVGAAVDAGVQVNTGLGQGVDGTAADAAADQLVDLEGRQKGCQGAVATAIGVHDNGSGDAAVLHVIDLKLLSVTEVLENGASVIGYCDSHMIAPFAWFKSIIAHFPEFGAKKRKKFPRKKPMSLS